MGIGEDILAGIQRLEKKLDGLIAAKAVSSVPMVADEADLASPKGNPIVRFSPKNYRGVSCVNKKFSECPPAFLDMYAEALQYSAEHPKEGKSQYAALSAKDAARARGWSAKIKAGWKPPAAEADEYAQPAPTTDDYLTDETYED
jgi:hypothetical protein